MRMQKFSAEQFSKSLVIFTDGSSLGNPGPGGYGCVVVSQKLDEVIELGGNKIKTTNNEMELSAVISALSHSVFNTMDVDIFTDSSYVINGITKWVHGWQKNGWKTQAKEDVANKALWQSLITLVKERELHSKVRWNYAPGHVGVVGNERCDEIATSFAAGKDAHLFRGKLSQYKLDVLNFSIDESLKKDKSEKRARSNAPAHSYLSLVDGVAMRHKTWAETEVRVKGKKAKFKKSLSAANEGEILKEWGASL
ncbi:MAG: ribonuclease [Patescibacteria group bacterium]|nr:ribonuclease [Patescibacteria group bacterium]